MLAVRTFSSGQETEKGVHVGSSKAAVKRAYRRSGGFDCARVVRVLSAKDPACAGGGSDSLDTAFHMHKGVVRWITQTRGGFCE